MTPEQRAVKWFEKVPEADDLSFDQRLAICKKTGIAMALVFVVLFLLELILAYVLTDGSFVFTMTDTLNSMLSRPGRRVTAQGVAVAGIFVVAPLLVIPVAATFLARFIVFKQEIKKCLSKLVKAFIRPRVKLGSFY